MSETSFKDDAPELCEAHFSKDGAVFMVGGKRVTAEEWQAAVRRSEDAKYGEREG